jgi:hypothetical protein
MRCRRVVYENVKATERAFSERNKIPHLCVFAHVCTKEGGATSGTFDRAHSLPPTGLVDVGDDHRRTSRTKTSSNRSPAPDASGAGYDDNALILGNRRMGSWCGLACRLTPQLSGRALPYEARRVCTIK